MVAWFSFERLRLNKGRQIKLQSDSPALTCSDVGIAQDVGFKLQIVQTMFDHVADADYPGELAVMDGMWRTRCRVIRSIT
jgi:hypothetical protein